LETLTYTDRVIGCRGYLVYDGTECRLAAGGCRVQPGLTLDTLALLASRMTLKQRVLGLNVDGAKCGLDYDPRAADVAEVLRRFLGFLRIELTTRFSMGCDMGTRFEDLEATAGLVGIPSIKYAIRTAQELRDDDFWKRMLVLDARIGRRTVSQRRAGHALAHATLAAVTHGGYRAPGLRVGLQGFGNLGRSAAESLVENGARIVKIADEYGCIANPSGFDVAALIDMPHNRSVPSLVPSQRTGPSAELFDSDMDVLVLAGGINDLTEEQAADVMAPVVVVGANCGLTAPAQRALERRGVTVIPDFVAGAGGSASMEALFGPSRLPRPEAVMTQIAVLITELVSDLLSGARDRHVTPTQVAEDIAAAALVAPGDRPYGHSPYASHVRAPRGRRARTIAGSLAPFHDQGGTA
jgi:glutamate dehydrogenase (NAD(P)+)